MSAAQDRIRFLGEKTRLQIAELCRSAPQTQTELAAALGRDPGSISQTRTMVERGALRKASRTLPSGRKAATYLLRASWRPALDEALRRAPASLPGDSRDLLFIPLAEVGRAATLLAAGIDGIEWGADVRGGLAGLLLAVRRDEAGRNTIRVLDSLGSAASSAVPLHLVRSMSAAQLQEWAQGLEPQAALPP